MQPFVSAAVYIVCLVIGWRLGRAEGRPIAGLLYPLILGPLGLLFFLAGREWRRAKDARRATESSPS